MSKTIYETIRGLELARVKVEEVRMDLRTYAQRTQELDQRVRISLNFLPYRAEALNLITETSAKSRTWEAVLQMVSSKLDVMTRELKFAQGEPMTDEQPAEPRERRMEEDIAEGPTVQEPEAIPQEQPPSTVEQPPGEKEETWIDAGNLFAPSRNKDGHGGKSKKANAPKNSSTTDAGGGARAGNEIEQPIYCKTDIKNI